MQGKQCLKALDAITKGNRSIRRARPHFTEGENSGDREGCKEGQGRERNISLAM